MLFHAPRVAWKNGAAIAGERALPEEVPVALTYGAATHAVMLATPADLEDFAVGFSLTEGIVGSAGEITELEIVPREHGLEARMWLAEDAADNMALRRRHLVGASGCGLCGMESLAEAVKPPRPVRAAGPVLTPEQIATAIGTLWDAQVLNQQTRAVHAAAFWRPGAGLVALREDVGRHNALDKLVGALARIGELPEAGAVVLSSRVSVEMVQKAAMLGAPLVVAVSAPTALALRVAEQAGITLVAIARGAEFEVFTHPRRIAGLSPA